MLFRSKYEDHADFGAAKPSIAIPDWVIRKTEEDRKAKTPIPQEARWYTPGDDLAQRVQAVAEAVGLEGVQVTLQPPAAIDARKDLEPV